MALPGPPASAAVRPSALVVFLEGTRFASLPQLSSAILSATQGGYSTAQMLLDMSQGARVSQSAYGHSSPPRLALAGERIAGWRAAVRRADDAPQLLRPGLLAGAVPGGGAYVGVEKEGAPDAPLAADERGRVAAVSLGPAATLLSRVGRARSSHLLTVADLPGGQAGYRDLRSLLASRPAGELLIAVQRLRASGGDPAIAAPALKGSELLWLALAGPMPGGQTLTSQTTNERGLIAAIDLAPTILEHLRLRVPAEVRGKPIAGDGPLHASQLRALRARLLVVSGRRLPAVGWLLLAWALLLGLARLSAHGGQGRGQAARRRAREAWAMRVGALALLWTPVAVLVTAALEPSRAVELGLLAALCLSLAAFTDKLLAWPRAPLLPALVATVAIVADALAKTQLLMRSLLGPNPAFGARFYGIGNELKPGLAVLALCGVAAALYPSVRGRRPAMAMAASGAVLAVVEGSARIGAGVGGVILVCAATAVASAMLLPGAPTRRRVLLVLLAPAAGLVALAAIDLLTAHGGGHFTGSVLHARSAGDVRDILVRRYKAAWDELRNHAMPFATALALLAGGLGVHRRERVTAPVGGDPAWLAALCGGLTAGVVGALTEDSGPVLLVVAVGALFCVVTYLWGRPPHAESPARVPAAAPAHELARS
jgi:hypothetical protein